MIMNLFRTLCIVVTFTTFVNAKLGEVNFNVSQSIVTLDNLSYQSTSFIHFDERYFLLQEPDANLDLNASSFFNLESDLISSEQKYDMNSSFSIYGNRTFGDFTPEFLASYWYLNQISNFLYPTFVDAGLRKKDAIYGGVGVSAFNNTSVRAYYKTNSYNVEEDSDPRRIADVLSRLKVTTPTLFSNTHISLIADYQQPLYDAIGYINRPNALIYNNYVKSNLSIVREDNFIKNLDLGVGVNYFYNSEAGYNTNLQPTINYRKKFGNTHFNLSYENYYSIADQYIIKQYAELSLYNNNIDENLNTNGFLLKLRLTDFRAHISPTLRVNYRKYFGETIYVKPKLLLHYSSKFSNEVTNIVYTVDEIEIGKELIKGLDAYVSPYITYVFNDYDQIANVNIQAGAKYNF